MCLSPLPACALLGRSEGALSGARVGSGGTRAGVSPLGSSASCMPAIPLYMGGVCVGLLGFGGWPHWPLAGTSPSRHRAGGATGKGPTRAWRCQPGGSYLWPRHRSPLLLDGLILFSKRSLVHLTQSRVSRHLCGQPALSLAPQWVNLGFGIKNAHCWANLTFTLGIQEGLPLWANPGFIW